MAKGYIFERTGAIDVDAGFQVSVASPEGKTIYHDQHPIGTDNILKLEINVPIFIKNSLIIKLTKHDAVDYKGYTLELLASLINQVNRDWEIVKSYPVPQGDGELIQDTFKTFQVIRNLRIRVKSARNEIVFDEEKLWQELEPVTQGSDEKLFPVTLPVAPNQFDTTVTLKIDEALATNPWNNHKLIAIYETKDVETFEFLKSFEDEFPISAEGTAIIKIEYYGLVETITFQVKSPGGEIIGRSNKSPAEINGKEFTITVPPRQTPAELLFDRLPERPSKSIGRVIDRYGKIKIENIQVIIFASQQDNPTDDTFYPILTALTETDGYFRIDTPANPYTKAYGIVGVAGQDENNLKVPIRLEADQIIRRYKDDTGTIVEEEKEALFFPDKFILVVDIEAETTDDEACDCGDCKDLDFHRPRKVLEEFIYYSVVRTTEPQIQGFTLEEDGNIELEEVVALAPGLQTALEEAAVSRNTPIRKNILLKTY